MLRPDSLDRGDVLTDGVLALLAEAGASGVSLRRLADRLGCSVGALTNQWRSRGRMLHVAVNQFRHRWNGLLMPRCLRDGISGLLPADDEEAEDCQVWFAFCELARTDATVAECVAAQRADEHDLVRLVLRDRGDESTVDAVLALVDGLRLAVSSPRPMPVARARVALDQQLGLMGLPSEEQRRRRVLDHPRHVGEEA